MNDGAGAPTARLAAAVTELVATATHAPSSHNTQPWLFTASGNIIELHADRRRRLPVNDPEDRELVMSCGAALFTLRIAAAKNGVVAHVRTFPDPQREDLLAIVELAEPVASADDLGELTELAEVVTVRRTHRGAFLTEALQPGNVEEFQQAAEAAGAALREVTGTARNQLASSVARGDRMQFADPAWRRELASWMRPPGSVDGLPVKAPSFTKALIVRLNVGSRTAAKDAELVRAAPFVGLLTTPTDDEQHRLLAGEALQRVALTAARHGLRVGYLNQPCQVPELREELSATFAGPGAVVEAVVRIGVPPTRNYPVPGRRPVTDVLRM